MVASVIFYAVVCWGSRVKAADANRLNKLIRKAGSVLGVELESLVEVSERRMLSKLLSTMDNASHPLHATLESYQSIFSRRLILLRCTTKCHRRSFLPVAIKLYNSQLKYKIMNTAISCAILPFNITCIFLSITCNINITAQHHVRYSQYHVL